MKRKDQPIWIAGDTAIGRHWNTIRLLTGLAVGRSGHQLISMQLQFKEETVLIILKKKSPTGDQVAFLEAATLELVLWVMASAIKSKTVPWKANKWTSMRSDKKEDPR
jgi:hypothetical protein